MCSCDVVRARGVRIPVKWTKVDKDCYVLLDCFIGNSIGIIVAPKEQKDR